MEAWSRAPWSLPAPRWPPRTPTVAGRRWRRVTPQTDGAAAAEQQEGHQRDQKRSTEQAGERDRPPIRAGTRGRACGHEGRRATDGAIHRPVHRRANGEWQFGLRRRVGCGHECRGCGRERQGGGHERRGCGHEPRRLRAPALERARQLGPELPGGRTLRGIGRERLRDRLIEGRPERWRHRRDRVHRQLARGDHLADAVGRAGQPAGQPEERDDAEAMDVRGRDCPHRPQAAPGRGRRASRRSSRRPSARSDPRRRCQGPRCGPDRPTAARSTA